MPSPQLEKVMEHLDDADIQYVTQLVARRIVKWYKGHIDFDESLGWSGVGVACAIKLLNPDLISNEKERARSQIMIWLNTKGFFQAVDAMRNAKVVDREVNGKIAARSIKSKAFSQLVDPDGQSENSDETFYFPADMRENEPSATVMGEDFFEWATSLLSEQEHEIFYYYYKCNLSMREIGVLLSLSESRVSQIHGLALKVLRGRVEEDDRQPSSR